MESKPISLRHRIFDKFYPLIRFVYEKIGGQSWFSQITPIQGIPETLWLGGGPDYERDRRFLLEKGIRAVVNIRAERSDPEDFYRQHDIRFVRFYVPDVTTPNPQVISQAVSWIKTQVADGRAVLVHCAKGRGRSATLLAAYLMQVHGFTYDQAAQLIKSRRHLTKLEMRHQKALEAWINAQNPSII